MYVRFARIDGFPYVSQPIEFWVPDRSWHAMPGSPKRGAVYGAWMKSL